MKLLNTAKDIGYLAILASVSSYSYSYSYSAYAIVETVSTGFHIPKSQSRKITVSGVCKNVVNNSLYNQFFATKSIT